MKSLDQKVHAAPEILKAYGFRLDKDGDWVNDSIGEQYYVLASIGPRYLSITVLGPNDCPSSGGIYSARLIYRLMPRDVLGASLATAKGVARYAAE